MQPARRTGTVVGNDARSEPVNCLRHQRRRHVLRRGAIRPTACVIQYVGPRHLLVGRVERGLLPWRSWNREQGVDAVARGIEPMPNMMRAKPMITHDPSLVRHPLSKCYP